MKKTSLLIILSVFFVGSLAAGCASQAKPGLNVVATTTIIGDVVRIVGGDRINLVVLLPIGADPHTYEPRPLDVAAIQESDILFLNGLELEHSLEPIIAANAKGQVIEVSNGVTVLPFSATEGDNEHAAGDPHTWMDPNNIKIWVENIEKALSQKDPAGVEIFQKNAAAYLEQLTALDGWISDEINQLPVENRKLITDHQSLGYFTNRYGMTQVGLILPSLSTNASASAADIAKVEEVINQFGIHTIFIEMGANDNLASQIAQDTGAAVNRIFTGSLGTIQSGAGSYLDFMRFNVAVIVEGLK
jgi:manganese/iron transport system substrate-binding protein